MRAPGKKVIYRAGQTQAGFKGACKWPESVSKVQALLRLMPRMRRSFAPVATAVANPYVAYWLLAVACCRSLQTDNSGS